MKPEHESKALRRYTDLLAAEVKWRFKATILKDVFIAGVKRHSEGDVLRPKGFYYNGHRDKWVVLVGDVLAGHAVRMMVPRDSVRIEAEERVADEDERVDFT